MEILKNPPEFCPLCAQKDCHPRARLSAQDIVKCWAIDGQYFSQTAVSEFLEADVIVLSRCKHCGFKFSDAQLESSARFYEELSKGKPDYYALNRPENKRNALYAAQQHFESVLDVGCGTGYALD